MRQKRKGRSLGVGAKTASEGTALIMIQVGDRFDCADEDCACEVEITKIPKNLEETGNLGICESCGEQIADARLKALPWARLCVRCAQRGNSVFVHSEP